MLYLLVAMTSGSLQEIAMFYSSKETLERFEAAIARRPMEGRVSHVPQSRKTLQKESAKHIQMFRSFFERPLQLMSAFHTSKMLEDILPASTFSGFSLLLVRSIVLVLMNIITLATFNISSLVYMIEFHIFALVCL